MEVQTTVSDILVLTCCECLKLLSVNLTLPSYHYPLAIDSVVENSYIKRNTPYGNINLVFLSNLRDNIR